jgi:hypothetical protein
MVQEAATVAVMAADLAVALVALVAADLAVATVAVAVMEEAPKLQTLSL